MSPSTSCFVLQNAKCWIFMTELHLGGPAGGDQERSSPGGTDTGGDWR